mgnify:CR=1 FL=1
MIYDYLKEKVESCNDEMCWEWPYGKDGHGYGRVYVKGRTTNAHQAAYRLKFGDYDSINFDLDHLCRNVWCWNPNHLEKITHQENISRGYAVRTICKYGHPLDGLRNNGRHRFCKTCKKFLDSQRIMINGIRKYV